MAEKKTATKKVEEVASEAVVAAPKAAKKPAAKKPAAKKAPKAEKVAEVKEVKKESKKKVELKAPVTEAKAIATNVRVTPRKVRLVLELVRGKDVKVALDILQNLNKSASLPVSKVIKSAAANAANNFNLDEERLYVAEIYANDGLRMKRFMPRAKGSASGITKRTAHIVCVVKER